jgi:hypothetical protein
VRRQNEPQKNLIVIAGGFLNQVQLYAVSLAGPDFLAKAREQASPFADQRQGALQSMFFHLDNGSLVELRSTLNRPQALEAQPL